MPLFFFAWFESTFHKYGLCMVFAILLFGANGCLGSVLVGCALKNCIMRNLRMYGCI